MGDVIEKYELDDRSTHFLVKYLLTKGSPEGLYMEASFYGGMQAIDKFAYECYDKELKKKISGIKDRILENIEAVSSGRFEIREDESFNGTGQRPSVKENGYMIFRFNDHWGEKERETGEIQIFVRNSEIDIPLGYARQKQKQIDYSEEVEW